MMQEQMPHKLTLSERKSLTMTGVTDVISFDDRAVTLKTGLGMLTIHGQSLQLKQLSPDGGQVAVEGEISALVYAQIGQERNFWGRLFG